MTTSEALKIQYAYERNDVTQQFNRQAPPGSVTSFAELVRLEAQAVQAKRAQGRYWANYLVARLNGHPNAEFLGVPLHTTEEQRDRAIWACLRAGNSAPEIRRTSKRKPDDSTGGA